MDWIGGITGPWPAFLAGLVTSLHCIGMCGPLACFLGPKTGSAVSFSTIAALYHMGRLLSYTAVGAVAGAIGLTALGWVQVYNQSLSRFLPWLLVLFFLVIAFRLDRWVPKPACLGRWFHRSNARFQQLPRPLAGLLVGLCTPLLPCAPLYAVFGLALMTQSPVKGAEFLLLFGMGTLPLLWTVQALFNRWQARVSPLWILRIQRAVAFIAAIVIGLRLYFYETGEGGLFCG